MRGVTICLLAALAAGARASAQNVVTNPSGDQTVVQPEGTEFELQTQKHTVGMGDPDAFGEVVVARDDDDTVHSVIRQTGRQFHLRLSAGEDVLGTGRGRHLLIGPYNYGMAVEHKGILEFWVGQFSVHFHPEYAVPGLGAWFWVGDEIDAGGLFASAHWDPDPRQRFTVLASAMFDHTSHGSLHFEVRDPADTFRFRYGTFFGAETRAEFGTAGSSSHLGLYSGALKAYLAADSAGGGAVRLTGTQAARVEIGAGPAPALRVHAGGDVEVGDGSTGAALLPATGGQELGLPDRRWSALRTEAVDATGAVVAGLHLVPRQAVPVFDAALGNTQKLVLERDVATSRLVNAAPGQTLNFLICQDQTGKHKFTWPANTSGGRLVAMKAGTCSVQSFVFDGTTAWAVSPGVAPLEP